MLPERALPSPPLTVGMAGTFDIENYGDLLFPLIASEALRRRDPRIQVVPFSVTSKSESLWPFRVRPVDELIAALPNLAALLIGGGQIVRFDRRYYPVEVPARVDMPVAYWLTPAAQAALAGTPVIWNAVGAWTRSPRHPRREELLRQVFAASHFVGVRDAASRGHLAKIAPSAEIEPVPDTAFGLSRLWPLGEESAEFVRWRSTLGLDGKYVVIQANAAVGLERSRIEGYVESMGGISAVVLPICWCHGDRAEDFPEMKGRALLIREWLGPKLISEIIGRSEFVFASSLHACITALSYGVPGARAANYSDRKFELLDEFEGIVPIGEKKKVSHLMNRGRRIEPRVIECQDRLERYWDMVADVVVRPPEQSEQARNVMMGWAATACKDQRPHARWAMALRKTIAQRVPVRRRVAIRHPLASLKNLAVTAFRRAARGVMAPGAGKILNPEPTTETRRH